MADFNNETALIYEPDTWSYYKARVIPEVIPGFIIGCISFLIFLVFLGWVIYQYCTCCCRGACWRSCFRCCRKGKSAPAEAKFTQFIEEGQAHDAPDPVVIAEEGTGVKSAASHGIEDSPEVKPVTDVNENAPTPAKKRRIKFNLELIEKILIVVLTLGTVACVIWGIQASLTSTDSQISGIWQIVDSISDIVDETSTALSTLSEQLNTLQLSVAAIGNESSAIGIALTPLGVARDIISSGVAALQAGAAGINTTSESISKGVNALNEYVAANINDIVDSYQPPTITFEDRGRIAAIVVLFVLILIATIISGVFTYLAAWSKTASISTLVMWFVTFLLFVLGSGIIKGISKVTNDTCLYAETFVLATIESKISNPLEEAFVMKAVRFYMDPNPPPPGTTFGSDLSYVTGVALDAIDGAVESKVVTNFVNAVNSPQATAAMSTVLQPATVQGIQNITNVIQPMIRTMSQLVNLASRNTTQPLYYDIKSLVCCDGWHATVILGAAWTAVGSLAFALGLLCIWRLLRYKHWVNKKPKGTVPPATNTGAAPLTPLTSIKSTS